MDFKNSMDLPVGIVNSLRRALSNVRPAIKPRRRPALVDEGSKQMFGLTVGAHEVLFKADSVFPFTLFPDSIVIDREKLTIANRTFFRVATINTVPIQDILSIQASLGPFFGSLRISSRYFVTNPVNIRYLWRSDAIQIQRILQGYIIAHEREIDCSTIEKHQLRNLLLDLGQGVSD